MSISLNTFLDQLDFEVKKYNLKIVMVRNFESLPKNNIAKDIDLIVREKDLGTWLSCLKKICGDNGSKCLIMKFSWYCVNTVIEGVSDKDGNLKLDLNYRFNWRGIDFYSTEQLYQESIEYGSTYINIASFGVRSFITLCHSYLYGGFLPKKYIYMFKVLEKDPKELEIFNRHLDLVIGHWARVSLWKRLHNNDFYVPRWLANIHRIGIFMRAFYRRPLYTTLGLLNSYKIPRIEVDQ